MSASGLEITEFPYNSDKWTNGLKLSLNDFDCYVDNINEFRLKY